MWKTILLIACLTSFVSADEFQVLDLRISEVKILEQVNEERNKRNLPPLELNGQLKQAADLHASNMVRLGEMSHTLNVPGQKTLTDRMKVVGYQWVFIGENIAEGYKEDKVVDGWMNSSGHRANILGNFTEMGIAVRYSAKGRPYYCQTFGKPSVDDK